MGGTGSGAALLALLGGACVGAAVLGWVAARRGRRTEDQLEQDKARVWAMRREMFCGAQSVSYSNSDPLMIVKAWKHWLVDEQGRTFLDTRNNVGHVGWQHPAVVAAVQRQLAMTNANTRYLHPTVVRLADQLLKTMPKPLAKVFFVNSGSEANDLALRLAEAHTRRSKRGARPGDCIVVDRAYHGHTSAVIEISPYKFAGQGGNGKPDWVQVVPCPDAYRQAEPREGADAFGRRMAAHVAEACERIARRGSHVRAFFIESGMSVAGVILPPSSYLQTVYEIVREHGGVCVADEVQVGFGRFGTHFWGFQQQGVVPDIVTMGKPFGNGFPLAAVVCTAEVAESFTNGMEYFNTFGGNPAACAAGLAVLQTIEKDGLQAHARETGEHFMASLLALQQTDRGQLIGDVRGSGLFLGIEFVRDRETRVPATEEVSVIATHLLQTHRILTSCDGEHHNVLVIKPPMTFGVAEVDRFVEALADALDVAGRADLADVQLTPT